MGVGRGTESILVHIIQYVSDVVNEYCVDVAFLQLRLKSSFSLCRKQDKIVLWTADASHVIAV